MENASYNATSKGVPSAGPATASPAEGEKNINPATKDAETTNLHNELVDLLGIDIVTQYYNKKLLYDKYCDKMLKRRKSSKIINCDVLTQKGPITLQVYREDGTIEVIPNIKVSDLHLVEWKEVTSSSGSVLKEPEIQKLQMQAKIFKENSLNKFVRTFKFQLSQHMNNLETLLNAETLQEMDSKSALSVIKVQFERFINSDLLKPLDIYSRSFSSSRKVLPQNQVPTDIAIETECTDERAALANLIANLTLDTEEKMNNFKESKRIIDSRIGKNEFEKYKAFNDRTIDYEILQTKLNETLGLLALKDIEIKEGLKTKAYEISVLNQKHDELVKKSLLTKSQLEGYLKENTKVISDLKVKEDKDIDKMIEMDKQSTFANPKYLKIAQSEKPRLYEILYDTSDPANRFCPNGEETVTLEKNNGLFKQVTQQNLPQIRKQAVRNTNVIALGPSRNNPKHVSSQSPKEFVGSNDMCLYSANHDDALRTPLKVMLSFNGQKQQRIDLNADALYNEKQENLRVWPRSSMLKMMSDHNSSDLAPQRQMVSAENNTSGPNSEFKTTAEPSSSKLGFQNFCSSTVKTCYIMTRVGITIPPSYSNAEDNSHKVVRLGINPMIQPELEDLPKDNPKLEIAVLRWQSAPASEY
ncbi:hypothetical protein Tco_0538473 [Tanacetum coccineum]